MNTNLRSDRLSDDLPKLVGYNPDPSQPDALHQCEVRYQAIVEAQTDYICRFLPDGILTFVNQAFCRYADRPRHESIGSNIFHLIPATDRQVVRQKLQSLSMENPESVRYHQILTPSGEWRWQQWIDRAIFDPLGQLVELQSVGRDLNDREQVEYALQTSEEYLRLLVQGVKDYAIYMLDPSGCIVSWNTGAKNIYGFKAEDIIGRHFACFFLPEDQQQGQPRIELQQAMVRGKLEVEGSRLRADGSTFWANEILTALWDDRDCLRGFAQVTQDLTARKQAEAALQRSESKYRALVNDASDAILLCDLQGNLIEANKQAEELLGYSQAEFVKMHVSQIYPPQERTHTLAVLADIARTGRGRVPNSLVQQKDGQTVWVDITSSIVEWGEGEKVQQSILRDITYRVKTEAKLRTKARQEQSISEIASRIHQSLELDRILETTVDEVRQYLQCDRVLIYRFNPHGQAVVAAESVGEGWNEVLATTLEDPCFVKHYAQTDQQGRIYVLDDVNTAHLSPCHLDRLTQFQAKANLVVSILQREQLWGLLVVQECSKTRKWQHSEQKFLMQLTTQVGIAIQQSQLYQQLQQANEELQKLATVDGLTQLANRRQFDTYLEREWERSAREGDPLSLILCDLDFFKAYNDSYGHQAGDDCLRQIAAALQETVKRPSDLAARYGGEELAVILPNTPRQGAVHVAEDIRARVRSLKLPHGGSPLDGRVTLSLGVATCVGDRRFSPAELIAQADGALYQAKALGRDRTCVAQA